MAVSQSWEANRPDPSGAVVHAVCGRRLRLLDEWRQAPDGRPMARLELIADDGLSTRRAERLQDEAQQARELMAAGTARGAFELRDTVVGAAAVCDAATHPLWRASPRPPLHLKALSFWLAARCW